MTDHQYRTDLKAYANSDLSELAGLLFQKKKINFTQKSRDFGTAFHACILEPETQTDFSKLDADQLHHIEEMATAIWCERDLSIILHDAEKETVRQWICPTTGLPLKARLDAVVLPRRLHIIDLKTTSCTSKAQFTETCYEYDYDRQAAFYLESVPGAKYFEFVGVMKTAPYKLFRLVFHRNDEFITYGKKKMDFLLGRALEESRKPDGWRPSAWSRKEEQAL